MCGCGSEWHGLAADVVVLGSWLDLFQPKRFCDQSAWLPVSVVITAGCLHKKNDADL